MLDYRDVYTVLQGQVKFTQVNRPNYPKLHPSLLQAENEFRLLVNDINDAGTFLYPEFIYEVIEDFRPELLNVYPTWDSATTYQPETFVNYDDGTNTFVYVSRIESTNSTPAFDSDDWETILSYYLRKTQRQITINLVNEVFQEKGVRDNIEELLDLTPLFSSYDEVQPVQFTTPRLRGFQVELIDINYLRMNIFRLGINASIAQTIPFYIYHSSQNEAISTFNIEVTQPNRFVWYDVDIFLNFFSNNYHAGGKFYIAYYDDDLLNGTVITGFDDLYTYAQNIRYFANFQHVDLDPQFKPNLPDIDSFDQPETIPFSLQVKADCDYTYSVRNYPEGWDKALQHKIAIKILSEMMNSSRISKEKEQIIKRLPMILKGTFDGQGNTLHKGLYAYLSTLKKKITIDLTNLDQCCLTDKAFGWNSFY